MGSGSENSVERKSEVLRQESNQVNASLNNCEDVQMGQRVVNKIDLNFFCAKENNETRDMSPSVVTGADNNINVTLPRDDDKAAETEADFRVKLCGRTFCGRAERCFMLKLVVFLCCVCLFVTLLYVFTRPPGAGVRCEGSAQCAEGQACTSGTCSNPCQGACDEESFCEVKGHVPSCFQPGNIQKLITNPDAYSSNNYTWYPAPRGSVVRFKVKANNDANVFIAQAANPTNFPYYCITIGGSSNKWSGISMNRFLENYFQAHVRTPQILSPGQFRGFWVRFTDGIVAVGKEGEVAAFMSYTDPKPLNFSFFGVSTSDSRGQWIIYGAGCESSDQCGEGRACVTGACGDPCQSTCSTDSFCESKGHDPSCFQLDNATKLITNVYSIDNFDYTFYPVPASSVIRFRVRASNDANVLLSGTGDATTRPYYEIIIGGTSNTRSGIRTDRQHLSDHKVLVETEGFMSQSQFRGFWVSFLGGTISVGKENEETAFMSWTDPKPFKVRFFGLSTFGAIGEWIIYD